MLRQKAPAFGRLSGGELALVPLGGLSRLQPPVSLAELMERLSEVGVAAVAIQGSPPLAAGGVADRLKLPLLLLPDGQSLPLLEQELNRRLVEWQGELRHQSDHVYRQLMELALAHRGQPAIIERLSRILSRPTSLEDPDGRLLTFATHNGNAPGRDEAAELLRASQSRATAWIETVSLNAADPPVQCIDLPDKNLCRLVAPVVDHERVAGWVSVWAPSAQVGALERLAIARGAAACAVEVSWSRAVDQARDQLQGNLAHDLITGAFGDARDAIERAKRMGFDLEQPQAALAVTFSGLTIAEAGRRLGRRALWSQEGERLALFAPATARDAAALKAVGAAWRNELGALGAEEVSLGIGRAHEGLNGLRRAWKEAVEALSIGRSIFGERALTYFGDLGIYRFLLAAHDRGELERFHQDYLGALADYDQRHNGELLATLEAYFRSGQSPTAAASILHAHRNTVLYRLERIETIAGRRLSDPENCLALHLALRVRKVLGANGVM